MKINTQIPLLSFLAYGGNDKLNCQILKNLPDVEYKIIKKLVADILSDKIHINAKEFQRLKHFKNFLRRVLRVRVSGNLLMKHCKILTLIARVGLKHDEIRRQIRANSDREVERNGKDQKYFITSKKSSEGESGRETDSRSDISSQSSSSLSGEEEEEEEQQQQQEIAQTTEDEETDEN